MTDLAFRLTHVSKKLGTREVLRDVSFDVQYGDIFGYLGPNGAGKTTSIRILLGLLKADSGNVAVLGRDTSVDANRARLGFVLESDGLYENLSATDNLSYYASIYGIARQATRIEEVLTLVSLKHRSRDKVGTYSKGMRQRLALARAVLHNPDALVLDEPTAGVDPTGQIEVRQLVLDMARKEGKTIIFSSHNLDEVQRICSRIALIGHGEIKAIGRLDDLQRNMAGGGVTVETSKPVSDTDLSDLRSQPGITSVDRHKLDLHIGLDEERADVPAIVAFLSGRGVGIEQVNRKKASLEEIYTTILKEAEGR